MICDASAVAVVPRAAVIAARRITASGIVMPWRSLRIPSAIGALSLSRTWWLGGLLVVHRPVLRRRLTEGGQRRSAGAEPTRYGSILAQDHRSDQRTRVERTGGKD